MLAERRPYAPARTKDQLSSTLRDYGASECGVERYSNRLRLRLLGVDGTQVATKITQAWPCRLSLPDGSSSHRPGEYLSQGIKGGHPSLAQAPSRLGTSHPFNCTQDRCLLGRSAAAQSSTNRQAPQTSRLDAPLSTSSRPDPTTSDPTHCSTPGMANGRTRYHVGGGGGQGESDQHR